MSSVPSPQSPPALAPSFAARAVEPQLRALWEEAGVYRFAPDGRRSVFSIDTPPPTVSGSLHVGHLCSYSHADFIARYRRMRGDAVFYPMGYDDNGLPTERLVERRLGARADEIPAAEFVAACDQVSREVEEGYAATWRRLGLSIDWRFTYRTIDRAAQRVAQWSFLDLLHQGRAYRDKAPAIWCPECRTAIAQAELEDHERPTEYFTLAFRLDDGTALPIATTRPELLPACVAVFVHPEDPRYRRVIGRTAITPLLGDQVPLLADRSVDRDKGTGAVMSCTFGDATDVDWWRTYGLPLKETLGRDGRLTAQAGSLAGLRPSEARRTLLRDLAELGLLLDRWPSTQTVRVHERCGTPVEYLVTTQWFIRVLDQKDALLEAGSRVRWHPEAMQGRLADWIRGLRWDWCISRQRPYGVPFPVWYCNACCAVVAAQQADLPVDPRSQPAPRPCACGSVNLRPETDVQDTWATSALTPQIAANWPDQPELYTLVYPYRLRPQAHEIIRTWAFDTLVKQQAHFGTPPWRDTLISGWVMAPDGHGKLSKSRENGRDTPDALLDRYGADAVRYWASTAAPGRDVRLSEERLQGGVRLVAKLWNVARFAQHFLPDAEAADAVPSLAPADRWLLCSLHRLIGRVTASMESYDYATARADSEAFVWRTLANNYLELAKRRLYDANSPDHGGARFALRRALADLLALLAPFLPYVTEEIYQALFRRDGGPVSIHLCPWPAIDDAFLDPEAERAGEALVAIATAVRRFKSDAKLAMSAELARLEVASTDDGLAGQLRLSLLDLQSVSRARQVAVVEQIDPALTVLASEPPLAVGVAREPERVS